MLVQPKPYIERLRKRNHAFGRERRLNMVKEVLENQTPFPLPVSYADIDKEFFNWVDKGIDISYDGKKLPTYKLFSNQKLSEYSQTWKNIDDSGNIVMNFKTVTRDNNPLFGENQGGSYNIPGHRNYPLFMVKSLHENGDEYMKMYSMKQPFSVNIIYSVTVVCNKYEILNQFNELIQYEFNAIEKYIKPNGYYMPMVIDNIEDQSEYSIDDRKYYAQTYQIKLMAFIIRKEDFLVTKVPSRISINMVVNEDKSSYKKKKKNDTWFDELDNKANYTDIGKEIVPKLSDTELPKLDEAFAEDVCKTTQTDIKYPTRSHVKIEEDDDVCAPKEKSPYKFRTIKLIAEFPYCDERNVSFTLDKTIDVTEINLKNVHDFVIKRNSSVLNFDDDIRLNEGDIIDVLISREDEYKDSTLIIVGDDINNAYDSTVSFESELDEPIKEEDIYVNKKSGDGN